MFYNSFMRSSSNIKFKRKIMKYIAKNINKLHYEDKRIIGLTIHEFSFEVSKEKG